MSTGSVLTFSDEFDSLSLWNGATGHWSTKRFWVPESGSSHGDELQWYLNAVYAPTASVIPWTVGNGTLTIEAAPASDFIKPLINNYQYTSGWIETYHTFTQTYGYFEIRAQLPDGKGLWPAFWLAPADGSGPEEIDIMEVLGSNPGKLYSTMWTTDGSGEASSVGGHANVPDTSAGFHTYGVDWQADFVTWYFDGKPVFKAATPAAMHEPMYMILNLAVGGDWPGSPDATTGFPARMLIDYVRVYTTRPDEVGGDTTVIGAKGSETLSGTDGADSIYGGGGNDILKGGAGDDLLDGGSGKDKLTGGPGSDIFVVGRLFKQNVHITDFLPGEDLMLWNKKAFKALVVGAVDPKQFATGSKAKDGNDHIIYNPKNGKLFYDADGKGGKAAVDIGTLSKHLDLGVDDLWVL